MIMLHYHKIAIKNRPTDQTRFQKEKQNDGIKDMEEWLWKGMLKGEDKKQL